MLEGEEESSWPPVVSWVVRGVGQRAAIVKDFCPAVSVDDNLTMTARKHEAA